MVELKAAREGVWGICVVQAKAKGVVSSMYTQLCPRPFSRGTKRMAAAGLPSPSSQAAYLQLALVGEGLSSCKKGGAGQTKACKTKALKGA